MGLIFRRRVPLDRDRKTWVNVSGSGVSVSRRFGPITVNSRGHVTVHLLPGLSWRIF